jgi:hypothetical protein
VICLTAKQFNNLPRVVCLFISLDHQNDGLPLRSYVEANHVTFHPFLMIEQFQTGGKVTISISFFLAVEKLIVRYDQHQGKPVRLLFVRIRCMVLNVLGSNERKAESE